ncbi:MAG: DUF4398 domain-containing protein [Polyangiaceae bacterium]|jgi:hypothetical protein
MRVLSPLMLRFPSPRNCSIPRPWAAIGAVVAVLWSIPCTGGCAGALPPPTERLKATEAKIQAAEKDGAGSARAATEVLSRSKEAVARAKVAIQKGRHAEAGELLLRADADADLADALGKEGAVADTVEKVKKKLAEETSKDATKETGK